MCKQLTLIGPDRLFNSS